MRNTGKSSEKIWEDAHTRRGKRAFFTRLVDASEIRGRTGKVATSARSQPSDYILTVDGVMSYAEVKSTGHKTAFPFNLLKPVQVSAAKQVIAAGGNYDVYVHSLHLDQWFRIPMNIILSADVRSFNWSDLQELEWKP